jgi:hypothetical protein
VVRKRTARGRWVERRAAPAACDGTYSLARHTRPGSSSAARFWARQRIHHAGLGEGGRPGELLTFIIMKSTSTTSVGSWRISLQSVLTLALFSTCASHQTGD